MYGVRPSSHQLAQADCEAEQASQAIEHTGQSLDRGSMAYHERHYLIARKNGQRRIRVEADEVTYPAHILVR